MNKEVRCYGERGREITSSMKTEAEGIYLWDSAKHFEHKQKLWIPHSYLSYIDKIRRSDEALENHLKNTDENKKK